MSTHEIYFRMEEILLIEAENRYKLSVTHEIDHSGYLRDGEAVVTAGGASDDFDYAVVCQVRLEGGTPGNHVQVNHEPELPGFVQASNPDHEYIFDIYVEEAGSPIAWNGESGTPPKHRAKIKVADIRVMPLRPLDKN